VADLHSWASERAPELLARAEAEAVAVLRDALVEAATGRRQAQPKPKPERKRASRNEPAQGELVWAYCVVPADARPPRGVAGVDPRFPVERVEAAGLAVLVSRVPTAEFGAESLRENLNDIAWLERVARAHEAVLDQVMPETTLVPLRICTLYEDAQGARRMLEKERTVLTKALESVAGRQEWGLKLLVDPERLLAHARESSSEATSMAAEVEGATEAGAYMLRRRLERHLREMADGIAEELIVDVRDRVESLGFDYVTRPPQNRELSQHEGEMLMNVACLVDEVGLDQLRELAAGVGQDYESLGTHVEITGPWPPYNFVLGGDAATLA
jgi:gas vesicle protein GvpL/GvpF